MGERFAVGIDLGTSTSEICVFRHGRPEPVPVASSKSVVLPSLVALNSRDELLVGEEARGAVDVPGRGVRESKRLMGRDVEIPLGSRRHRPPEIAAIILRALKESAEVYLNQPVREAVVSVPANFDDVAKRATFDAARIAGLEVQLLVAEPTAAALAYGLTRLDADEQLLVFDFGGGTLDISILEMMSGVIEVRSSHGDVALGGKDFDDVMISLLKQRVIQSVPQVRLSANLDRDLKDRAERAKVDLSSRTTTEVQLRNVGATATQQIDLDVVVSRDDYDRHCSELLSRTRACLRTALGAKGVRPSSVQKILLVGGTSYIPAVRNIIEETFGKQGSADVPADLAVAMGASIRAAQVSGLLDGATGPVITDVAPKGVGIAVVEVVGDRRMLVYEPLIRPNTTIPFRTRKTYRLMSSEQDAVNVCVYQDSTGRARYPEDAVLMKEAVITDVPCASDGTPHAIEVLFQYDLNGLIRVEGTIPATGQTVVIEEKANAAVLSPEGRAAAEKRVSELWQSRPEAREFRAVIEKAERMLGELSGTSREAISQAVGELKAAIESGDAGATRRLGNRLVDLLYDCEREEE